VSYRQPDVRGIWDSRRTEFNANIFNTRNVSAIFAGANPPPPPSHDPHTPCVDCYLLSLRTIMFVICGVVDQSVPLPDRIDVRAD